MHFTFALVKPIFAPEIISELVTMTADFFFFQLSLKRQFSAQVPLFHNPDCSLETVLCRNFITLASEILLLPSLRVDTLL